MDSTPAQNSTVVSSAFPYAPDWHPDPTHRFEFRYHNGQSWTGDVAVDGRRFLDPLHTSPIDQTNAAFALPHAPSSTNRKAVAALVLVIGSLVVGWVPFISVLGVVAAVLGFIFGISGVRAARRNPQLTGRGLGVAAIVLAPIGLAVASFGIWFTVQVVHEFDRFAYVGQYSVATTRCDVDTQGVAHFDGTITNESPNAQSYHLVVEFLRSGTTNVLYIANTDVSDVAPGETARWSVQHPVQLITLDCRISAVTGPLPFANASP